MPRSSLPPRPVTGSRVFVFAMLAVGVAGCSDSGRFDSGALNPRDRGASQQDVTGSISSRPASSGSVQSQPLPDIGRPQTVASYPGGGVAQGAGGMGAYRPQAQISSGSDVTGSVTPPTGHWTWEGGTPVTVGANETVETIGRRHGVPASAILQANGLRGPEDVRPGQRIVIPRYALTRSQAAHSPAPQYATAQPVPQYQAPRPAAAAAPVAAPAAPQGSGAVHVVAPGETLMAISRRYGVTLASLAKANNIAPFTKVNVGDRITVPGTPRAMAPAATTQRVAEAPRAALPRVASPRIASAAPAIERPSTVPAAPVTRAPAETANVASQEVPAQEPATKAIDPAGNLPSFRWPVRGRVITGFGAKGNGSQNDGINLAVPEGTPVKAAEDGVVAYAGNELKGYGNLVLIRHPNGFVSAYAHASQMSVKRGDTVKRGQVIALAGQTGNVTSPQLHFEIRKGSAPVDPTKYLGAL